MQLPRRHFSFPPLPESALDVANCVRQVCRDDGRCRCSEYGITSVVPWSGGEFDAYGYRELRPTGTPGELAWFWIADRPKPHRPKLRRAVKERVCERDNWTCQMCGAVRPAGGLEVDHVTPLSRGGTNDMANLRAACVPCNRKKWYHLEGDD